MVVLRRTDVGSNHKKTIYYQKNKLMAEKKKIIQTPWKITADRFVGFIDIMGFKDIVARTNHQAVYEMMKKVSKTLELNRQYHSVNYTKDGIDVNVYMTMYSDSIMVYSRDNSETSLDNFIGCMSALSEDLFEDEIPHKGAIAYGTITLDFKNSIFFGQPLIDAYLLQDELKFYGLVVHSSAEYFKGFTSDELVIQYDCPFKNGTAKHITILPGIFIADPFNEKEYLKYIQSVSRLKIKTSGSLRKYIDNTLAYLEYSHSIWTKRIIDTKAYRKKTEPKSDKLPF